MNDLTLLTVEEVADMLRMTTSWIYARTGDGMLTGTGRGRRRSGKAGKSPQRRAGPADRIPHFKPGGGRLLRFDKQEVLAWFAKYHRNGCEAPGMQPGGHPQAIENIEPKLASLTSS